MVLKQVYSSQQKKIPPVIGSYNIAHAKRSDTEAHIIPDFRYLWALNEKQWPQ